MSRARGTILDIAAAIDKAAKAIGSEKALAAKIGVSRQRLNYWKLNTKLPYDKAVAIYVATEGLVELTELRPDLKSLTRNFERIILNKSVIH